MYFYTLLELACILYMTTYHSRIEIGPLVPNRTVIEHPSMESTNKIYLPDARFRCVHGISFRFVIGMALVLL